MNTNPPADMPGPGPTAPHQSAANHEFWIKVAAAAAPVVGIINRREQWPWDVVLDRSRPLPAALEWRLDSIFGDQQRGGNALPDPVALSRPPVPIVLTARHPDEGGDHQLGNAGRISLLLHFLNLADAVDVELRAVAEMQEVISATRAAGATLLVSAHHFDGTPSEPELRETVQQAAAAGADAVKIATRTDDPAALLRLLGLLSDRSAADPPLIVMGMGRLGKVSRLAAVACGSPLAYGHLGHANVSGQWHAVELAEALLRQSDPVA